MELYQAMLYVRDLTRAVDFYKCIGLHEIKSKTHALILCDDSNARAIVLHALEGPEPTASPDGVRLYFSVEDVQEVVAQLPYPPEQPPKQMPWGDTVAYLRDPDGFQIALVQRGVE